MRFTFYSKNYAVMKEMSLPGESTPRTGELVLVDEKMGLSANGTDHFFVFKVINEASAAGVVPHIHCRQWMRGDREGELASRGWLPGGDPSATEHDDG